MIFVTNNSKMYLILWLEIDPTRKEPFLMSLEERVQEILDKLRPYIQRDGGDVELVEIDNGIVRVRLLGACGSCPSSTITLKAGIERALMEEIPEVQEVEQVL